jgi:glutamate synthase (NADPH/NADH) large chain
VKKIIILDFIMNHLKKTLVRIGFVANIKGKATHDTVTDAITMLENMEHRGGCGCETNTGDGAGILIQIPHEYYKLELSKHGIILPNKGEYGCGITFFPKDKIEDCKQIIISAAKKLNFSILYWRHAPVNPELVGKTALSGEPEIQQLFILPNFDFTDADYLERKLFVFRNYVTHQIRKNIPNCEDLFYFTSLSCKTVIYKGQLTTWQVRPYFEDLKDENVTSAIALVHSRFSTNTFPKWKLAQPFRYLSS